jgi:uncharacterized LabA/DUF88 family protein
MVFVDATHVDHRCEEGFGRNDIDFVKFFAKLTQGTICKGIVYCYAEYLFEERRRPQTGALNRVKKIPGLKTYAGRHMRRGRDAPVEKGTDVAVASHLVQAACMKMADQLILVAGDNDYWPALEVAKEVGAFCKVAYFVGAHESDQKVFYQVQMLRNFCRGFVKLDQAFMADVWFTK